MEFYKSPLEKLYQWEQDRPDRVFFHQPASGNKYTWTWKETAREVRSMAAALQDLGLPPKSKVAILSKNCAHWIMSDLAIMMAGHVSVPLYPNQTADTLRQLLEHSETRAVFVGKLDHWEQLKEGIPDGLICITYPLYGPDEPAYLHWQTLVEAHEPIAADIVRDEDDLATIIYTSGTTGAPKGVMHRFYNFSFAASKAFDYLGFDHRERFFSYLPLSHIAERLLVEMGGIYSGGSISFAESLDTFKDDLGATRPTVFLGVPRIWVKFQEGILAKMPQKKLDRFLKIPILKGIIKKKIREGLGLGDAHDIYTGAAPTPASLIRWFQKLDINIQEAYAMTENCCYSHVTVKDRIEVGAVGQPLPDCEVRLGEQDEIQIRHAAIMQGYYKSDAATTEALTSDGWLRTGDVGSIDKKGFLKITGRVKDKFKTSKGKYVEPSPIELRLQENPFLSQICVVGTNIPNPIALATLAEDAMRLPRERVMESLMTTLRDVNPQLQKHEQVATVVLLKEEWTVENNLLTPTMKVKRQNIEKIHMPRYQEWFEKEGEVLFE